MVGREKADEPTALFLISPETGEKRRLTSPPARILADSCPAFSPDGRTLAFARMPAWTNSELYSLDLSPDFKPLAEAKRITSGNWRAQNPVWTNEGGAWVFSAWAGAESALWRVDRSGASRPERLATLGNNLGMPAISRDGHRLVYVQKVIDSNIWRLENPLFAGKSDPPRKFITSTRRDEFPQFSPDGKKIAFLSDRSGSLEIWVCDMDGSRPFQLTSFGKGVVGPPRWSPDGKRLAFESSESTLDGHPEMYIVNLNEGRPQRLTSTPFGINNPSWSHDGRWILYNDPTNLGIFKVPVTGGPPVQVTDRKVWAPLESPDGKYIYSIDSPDAFALRRDPTEGGPGERILPPLVAWTGFALVKGGIYFILRADPGSGYAIQFFDAASGKIRRIASLERSVALSLAVSPDQRWILYTQLDQTGSDLMLVENFRQGFLRSRASRPSCAA